MKKRRLTLEEHRIVGRSLAAAHRDIRSLLAVAAAASPAATESKLIAAFEPKLTALEESLRERFADEHPNENVDGVYDNVAPIDEPFTMAFPASWEEFATAGYRFRRAVQFWSELRIKLGTCDETAHIASINAAIRPLRRWLDTKCFATFMEDDGDGGRRHEMVYVFWGRVMEPESEKTLPVP